ncbi:hypothetical protein [Zoogloea sp.]|uniref:hypothetical protein n=1 Tax=Zoogloea sp. TaxID=49181 RepID=UPI0035AE46D5
MAPDRLATACCRLLLALPAIGADPSAATERADWLARLQWSAEDCPQASPDPERSGVVELPAARGRAYVQILCERWAYQGTSLIYRRTPDGGALLSFPQFESEAPGQRTRYVSPVLTGSLLGVDPDGQTLRVLRKYRGIGDCGQYLVYQVRGGQVSLKTLRVRECTETPRAFFPPPNQWPVKRR